MSDNQHQPTVLEELAELALSLDSDQLRNCGMGTHAVLTDFLLELRKVLLAIGKSRAERSAASASGTLSGAHGAKADR